MAIYASKTIKKEEDLDLDEELDSLLQPAAGHDRVYAVPRSY
jgi:hypothetical protein